MGKGGDGQSNLPVFPPKMREVLRRMPSQTGGSIKRCARPRALPRVLPLPDRLLRWRSGVPSSEQLLAQVAKKKRCRIKFWADKGSIALVPPRSLLLSPCHAIDPLRPITSTLSALFAPHVASRPVGIRSLVRSLSPSAFVQVNFLSPPALGQTKTRSSIIAISLVSPVLSLSLPSPVIMRQHLSSSP